MDLLCARYRKVTLISALEIWNTDPELEKRIWFLLRKILFFKIYKMSDSSWLMNKMWFLFIRPHRLLGNVIKYVTLAECMISQWVSLLAQPECIKLWLCTFSGRYLKYYWWWCFCLWNTNRRILLVTVSSTKHLVTHTMSSHRNVGTHTHIYFCDISVQPSHPLCPHQFFTW